MKNILFLSFLFSCFSMLPMLQSASSFSEKNSSLSEIQGQIEQTISNFEKEIHNFEVEAIREELNLSGFFNPTNPNTKDCSNNTKNRIEPESNTFSKKLKEHFKEELIKYGTEFVLSLTVAHLKSRTMPRPESN